MLSSKFPNPILIVAILRSHLFIVVKIQISPSQMYWKVLYFYGYDETTTLTLRVHQGCSLLFGSSYITVALHE